MAAEDAAHRVRGVKAVANEIEVRCRVPASAPTPDIAAAAVRALEWGCLCAVEKLDVTVSKGLGDAQGRGGVAIPKAGRRAVVRRLSGVQGVTNLITVSPASRRRS